MQFSRILNHFCGDQPQINGQRPKIARATNTPDEVQLSAKKVTSQFGTIARSYNLPPDRKTGSGITSMTLP